MTNSFQFAIILQIILLLLFGIIYKWEGHYKIMNKVNLLALKLIQGEICRRLGFKLQGLITFQANSHKQKNTKEKLKQDRKITTKIACCLHCIIWKSTLHPAQQDMSSLAPFCIGFFFVGN